MYVMGDRHMLSSVADRFKGYCRALLENGLQIRREYVYRSALFDEAFFKAPAAEKEYIQLLNAKTLYERYMNLFDKPDAICFVNDVSAGDFIQYTCSIGADIRKSAEIGGFDDLEKTAELGFCTVRQNFYSMGKRSLSALDRLIRGLPVPDKTAVKTDLILK